MRFTIVLLLLCILLAPSAAQAQNVKLTTAEDSLGYAIGMDLAKNFKKQGIEVDFEALAKALKDTYNDKPLLMTEEQSTAVIRGWQQAQQMKQQQEKMAKAQANLQKAQAFLAQNKTKPGVIELPSGLQYVVIQEGTGKSPLATDRVTTHYHGTLLDGTIFDSSVNRGQPATFPVNGVIQGWQQILPLMKEGGKVKLFCPPNLAYGESGMGDKIGPNELLVFEIELIKVGQ